MTKNDSNFYVQILRWCARVFAGFMILFFLLIFFGETVGAMHSDSYAGFHLPQASYLTFMLIGTIGLAVAWRWEFTGGLTALVAYLALGFFQPMIFTFPMIVFPFTGFLFLLTWFADKRLVPSGEVAH